MIRFFSLASLSLLVLNLMGCGAVDKAQNRMDSMDQKMEVMNGKMDQMNTQTKELERLQKQAVGLQMMLAEENTKYLFPPTRMAPGGKLFAENSTATEILDMCFKFIREATNISPDGTEVDPNALKAMEHEKLVNWTALQVVAGFVPQSVVEEIVAKEIVSTGRYEEVAYKFLMARALLVDGFLLSEDLTGRPITNVGLMEEAVRQTRYLDYVNRLPFGNKIQLQISGFSNPDMNQTIKLDPYMAYTQWKKIKVSVEKDFDTSGIEPQGTKDPSLSQIRAQNLEDYKKLKAEVDGAVAYWSQIKNP